MLMLSRVRDHLSHLRLCNFISEDAAYSLALGMDLQHNPSGFGTVHGKEPLQNVDHELHGSVVVIDQDYLIKGRLLELGRRLFDDQARSILPAFNVTHELTVYRARLSALQAMDINLTSQIRLSGPLPRCSASRKECRQSLSLYFNKQKQKLERPSTETV